MNGTMIRYLLILPLMIHFILLFFILDMRKPLPRDKKKETIRENGENVYIDPEYLDSSK